MKRSVTVEYSSKFLKSLSRLPAAIITKTQERERIFRQDAFDPLLATYKLHGKEKDVWAFSITHTHRIKFIFLTDTHVLFLEIGTHEIYK